MRRNLMVLLIVGLLAGIAVYQNAAATNKNVVLAKEEAAKINYLAPSFSLTGMAGKTYSVGGQREKALLINFWASWCPPCKVEAPDLQRNYEKYKHELDLYAVNTTISDTKENAKTFAESYGFTFPVLLDVEGTVSSLYRIQALPTSYFIDKNGVVQDIIIGIVSPKELERRIQKLLE